MKILNRYCCLLTYMIALGIFPNVLSAVPPAPESAPHEEAHSAHEDEEASENHLPLLTEAQRQELGIVHAVAGPDTLEEFLRMNGEIALNGERTAHVIIPLSGIVTQIYRQLGDTVQTGDPLALLESRELADAKTDYLASLEQLALAQDNERRKLPLFEQKALPDQQLFELKRALAETQIRHTSTARKLQALGLTQEAIRALPQSDQTLTQYTLTAPMQGTIVEKHITPGEFFHSETDSEERRAFVLSDLSELWVDFSVYPQDLPRLHKGQTVLLEADGLTQAQAEMIYVAPLIDRETRTALARARLPNPNGQWRAGLFVNGYAKTDEKTVAVAIPPTALIQSETGDAVFVVEDQQYALRPVQTGRHNRTQVEIRTGLKAGETYVSQGGFVLKAERGKAAFADGHGH